jgi:formate hydrogenlyase subunit 4
MGEPLTMRAVVAFLPPLFALVLAPLLPGLINRTKAFVAGRRGPPLLQPYWDLAKCLRRGAVYGDVTSWIFRLGPVVSLAAVLAALSIVPFGGIRSPLGFSGDLVVLAGLLALGRFATVLAALDTGSSFEGMGASREVHFAALAEPAFLLALAVLARLTDAFSLAPIYQAVTPAVWLGALPTLALVAMTFLILALVENSRIPVDDPTTHLELTMIHEVMVLDHSGPDLALIQYAAALKLWLLGSLLVGLVVPLHAANPVLDGAAMLFGMTVFAVVIGMIESAMARYRLAQVPQFIVAAATLSAVGFILILV